jgi:hypothetical protein
MNLKIGMEDSNGETYFLFSLDQRFSITDD